MSEFKKGISNEETRKLKEWGPGRFSQLKLWIKHLETAFDSNSLAAQVQQSPKRKFSEFVPNVVEQDIITETEFKEIRIAWEHPRGLRFLLFYEVQISEFENFAQFDSFITYDPFWVFVNLLDGVTYYIRIRVVNKDSLFGPWSETQEVTTPRTQGFGFFDGSEVSAPIISGNSFFPIWSATYNSIGGSLFYTICYDFTAFQNGSPTGTRAVQLDPEFRWMFDGKQLGGFFYLTGFATKSTGLDIEVRTADIGGVGDSLLLQAPFFLNRRGTFVQRLHATNEGQHEISLEARNPLTIVNSSNVPLSGLHPTPNDWIGITNTLRYGTADGQLAGFNDTVGRIALKNFSIFEVLVD